MSSMQMTNSVHAQQVRSDIGALRHELAMMGTILHYAYNAQLTVRAAPPQYTPPPTPHLTQFVPPPAPAPIYYPLHQW